MTFSIPQLVGAIVVLFVLACFTSGPGRQNRLNGYNQRQFSTMSPTPYSAPSMRPVARSSGFFSRVLWLLVLAVIAYFLLKQYAPDALYPLHSIVPWL